MRHRGQTAVLFCLLWLSLFLSSTQARENSMLSSDPSEVALAKHLRSLLIQFLPNPLFEDNKHWGMQKNFLRGRVKNDGRWHKLKVAPNDLNRTLVLRVTGKRNHGKGVSTFSVHMHFDSLILLERQTWKRGLRLYSGSTLARCKLQLTLNCELTTKIESSKGLIPDMVVRLRVTGASFAYRDLEVEHTAGLGGEAARILGEFLIGVVKVAKPDLERRLIEKANAAIVKAGDTKEVRLSLMDWISGSKNTKAVPTKKE